MEKRIRIKDKTFVLLIEKDNEIIFYDDMPDLDDALFEIDGIALSGTGMKYAIPLFRAIMKEIETYVYENHPPYLYFTVGGDEKRTKLYTILSKKFETFGYSVEDDGDIFMAVKVV